MKPKENKNEKPDGSQFNEPLSEAEIKALQDATTSNINYIKKQMEEDEKRDNNKSGGAQK